MQYEAGLRKLGITSTVLEDGDGTEVVIEDMPAGVIDIPEQTAYLPVKRVVAGLELGEDEADNSVDTVGVQRRGLKQKKPLKMPPAVCGVGRKPCADLGHPVSLLSHLRSGHIN